MVSEEPRVARNVTTLKLLVHASTASCLRSSFLDNSAVDSVVTNVQSNVAKMRRVQIEAALYRVANSRRVPSTLSNVDSLLPNPPWNTQRWMELDTSKKRIPQLANKNVRDTAAEWSTANRCRRSSMKEAAVSDAEAVLYTLCRLRSNTPGTEIAIVAANSIAHRERTTNPKKRLFIPVVVATYDA